MNLETALKELIKQPQSMIAKDGLSYPALRYTTNTHAAIRWLVDRYNDGTLDVIGYDPMEDIQKKRKERYEIRRKEYTDLDGYMSLVDFAKRSGIAKKTVRKIATDADALLKLNFYLYVNVNQFYQYLNSLQAQKKKEDHYVDLPHAAQMMNVTHKEVRNLLKEGKITEKPLVCRPHQISVNSINAYLKKKGAKNGKNNTDDGEVH